MPSSKNPKKGFRNILNAWTNCFGRARYKTWNRSGGSWLEIRKLCVVRAFVDIEKLVGAAMEVERVLGELEETSYESLREEHEEETSESNVEK
jgi:hypothetical protein